MNQKYYISQINIKPIKKNERGIPKYAISKAQISKFGIEGDGNIHRSIKDNNNADRAISILTDDVINQLNKEGWPIKPGHLGENLSLKNIKYKSIQPKQKYLIGTTIIQISFACSPCSTLRLLPYIGKKRIKEFTKTLTNRRGWYARVLQPGQITKNDLIFLV